MSDFSTPPGVPARWQGCLSFGRNFSGPSMHHCWRSMHPYADTHTTRSLMITVGTAAIRLGSVLRQTLAFCERAVTKPAFFARSVLHISELYVLQVTATPKRLCNISHSIGYSERVLIGFPFLVTRASRSGWVRRQFCRTMPRA